MTARRSRIRKPVTVHPTAPELPFALAQLETKASAKAAGDLLVTSWNKEAERVTGIRAREILGKPLSRFLKSGFEPLIHPGPSKRSSGNHTKSSPHSIDLQFKNIKHPLRASWYNTGPVHSVILSDPGVAESIQPGLEISSQLLDALADSLVHVDNKWTFTYVSPKAERILRILGVKARHLVGKTVAEVLPEVGGTEGFKHFERAMNERVSLVFEEYYAPLNSWFAVHAYPYAGGLAIYLQDITRRKLAEAAFLKLSNAVEQTADAVYITDTAGRIEYVNPAFETITGYTRGEALGKTFHFLKPESVDEKFYNSLWETALKGQTFHSTIQHNRKTGDAYYAEESITPVRDTNGSLTHLVATLRDITQRKATEDALRTSEERFRALVENSSDGIALLDATGKIIYAGPSTTRVMGYASRDVEGKLGIDFLHPDDRPNAEASLQELASHPERIISSQYRMKHKDGSWRWIETTTNNQLGEQSIGAIVVNYRDVTDRKIIEEALFRSETEYRNLFEQANDAIFIFEPENEIILEANTKACELYGYSKDELIGMSLKKMTKDVARGEEQIRQLLRNQAGRNFESVHFTKSGRPIEMLVNSAVVDYAEKKAILSICRDITELKKLENQLRQAQKMESIGTLAGGVAHDFNNILSIILGYTSMLKRGRVKPEKMPESLDAIQKATQRGANLVKQILTFARKTEVLFESLNINELITDLTKLLSETFPKTIVFSLNLQGKLPSVVADANQIHQLLLNLCVNARDAIPSKGKITITTEVVDGSVVTRRFSEARQSEFVHVSVSDSGVGMDETTKARIFEPFFTTKGQGQGTGLGLAVVYGIINNHRGFIDVESAPNVGTTFHIYFPIQMRGFETIRIAESKLEEIPGGTETILVAEDEEILLDLVQRLLESKGYEVITATDGLQAMDLYEKHKDRISLVLTDIGLPRLNGWEVCKRIAEAKSGVKVVVASGYLDPQVKSEMSNSAASDFIHKPYLPEDILTRIRGVLDGR